jgi:hypothetical protein
MKTLIALMFYAIVSGLIGLVTCGLLLWFKKKKAATIAAVVFFGGPLVTYVGLYIRDTINLDNLKKDIAYVEELCEKYGGYKIYKTVDNVEGIFQIKARNPDIYGELKDQYGMDNPWARESGDSAKLTAMLSFEGKGYLFIEQQPEYGKPEGPPYRLFYLKPTGRKMGDIYPNHVEKNRPETKLVEESVNKLHSRYGYLTEDISTKEMRSRWIAGGKIKIIDLQTKEVLAESTGYFKAVGLHAQLHWSGSSTSCPNIGLQGLLIKVLKPVEKQLTPQFANFKK